MSETTSTGDTADIYNMYVSGTGSNQTSTVVELPDNLTESTEGYLTVTSHSKASKRGISFRFHKGSLFKTNTRGNSQL